MKVPFLTFYVKNLETTVSFYETLADLQVIRRMENPFGKFAFLADEPGGMMLEFIETADGQRYSGSGFVLCFEPKDIAAVHLKAAEMGYAPTEIETWGPGPHFQLSDPNGVTVEFAVLQHE